MTETTTAPDNEPSSQSQVDVNDRKTWRQHVESILNFFWEMIRTVFLTLRALVFVIIKTPYMLVPSSAHTSLQDERYSKSLRKKLTDVVNELKDLDSEEKHVIIQNWIEQIGWTEGRATRERDANELIRWWQIILGVLIPVLANIEFEIVSNAVLISLAGIFVAVLTAIAQFRRPEERWRHYRLIHERYVTELWQFVALSGVYQEFRDQTNRHSAAFPVFDARMTAIRMEDLTKFFSEVVPPRQREQQGAKDGEHGVE